MRLFALIWLVIILVAGAYLGLRLHEGLKFQTDLMALLPRDEQDKQLQLANDKATAALSQRVVILVGSKSREKARIAAADIQKRLSTVLEVNTNGFDKDRLEQMGKIYFPYRFSLLSDDERELLQQGKSDQVAARALSQVYGLFGIANAKLLENDPFLLLPAFFSNLPLPMSHLHLDDGMLSTIDNGTTWILISGSLRGNPYALDVQEKFIGEYNKATAAHADVQTLKLGAVFFAHAGAKSAMDETSQIGLASTLGTILLVLLVFRASRPLLLNLLAIIIGVAVALSASLAIFGDLHVGAMLFGVSLIGIAVDYGLQYCSEIFAPDNAPPKTRLKHVLPGITLGMATTVIGYLTLLFAPFPGLYQIAAFSAIGLIAAWLTVVLWLPYLDNSSKPQHGQKLLQLANNFSNLWQKSNSWPRWPLIIALFVLALIGAFRFHFDDDVRRMQSLSAPLVNEQKQIEKLIGNNIGAQFFIIQGSDEQITLQREEELAAKLRPLIGQALAGFQSPAQYVPSAKRQIENWWLVKKLYAQQLPEQRKALNLSTPPAAPGEFKKLNIDEIKNLSFLSSLLLDKNTHVVMLDKVTDLAAVKAAANNIDDVKLIDPAGDFSALLAKYRNRTLILMALSTLFMLPLIFWRYGFIGGLWVKFPAVLAVVITPFIRAVLGSGFTFFDAIALLLVLSMGVDYAIFCAETDDKRKPATIIGVVMSALTAMLSFGLLAFSNMLAVHNFGATMLVGILLSLLFAPIAQRRS